MKKRNTTIDVLRIIGIFSVIAAHCEITQPFYAIREYDVVMLMVASGMSYAVVHKEKEEGAYLPYVWKRFKRLVLPVYLFLVIFFVLFKGILQEPYSAMTMIKSFALVAGGIMYVWVYRVFFTTGLLNPWMSKLVKKTGSSGAFLLSIGILYANTVLYKMIGHAGVGKLFEYLVTYTIGYAGMALCGIAFMYGNLRDRWVGFVAYLFVFFIGLKDCGFTSLQAFKHPPMLNYIGYGMMVTLALGMVFEKIQIPVLRSVTWLSNKAMTIYLWHIIYYYILVGGTVRRIPLKGFGLFILILGLSVISSGIQDFLKRRILK